MRILIDLTSLADNFSGFERFSACLTQEMLKKSTDDYILVFKEKVHPLFSDYVSCKNIKAIVLKRRKKLIFNQLILPFAISRIPADCYLFLAFPPPILLFKRNMVSAIHDICCWDCPETMKGLSSLYFRVSYRISLWKCWNIVTVSSFSKQRISNKFPASLNKLWRIYDGVETKFLQYQTVREKEEQVSAKYKLPPNYILSLSTLEPRKNLRLLISAYEKLVLEDDFDIPLVLAGRKGWKMDNLLNGIGQAARDKIIFTGFVEDEDLPAVYGGAKLFVFPSKYEGFGIPPLEAMACGTPVLSSDAASLPEVLGDAAAYFESDNELALYQQLRKLTATQFPEEIIQKGRNQAARFRWDEQAELLMKYLSKL